MTAGPRIDHSAVVRDSGEVTGSGTPRAPGTPRTSAAPVDVSGDGLEASRQRFVSLWSRMASTWGISRTMAEVHAWLFITGGPRHAEEVMEALGISRGNASMTLRRLEEWELVRRVHRRGDRKEYFEAEQDVWRMFRTILAQRKKRELDPLLEELDGCRVPRHASAPGDAADVHDRRIDEMAGFLALVDAIASRILTEDEDGDVAAELLGRIGGDASPSADGLSGTSPAPGGPASTGRDGGGEASP